MPYLAFPFAYQHRSCGRRQRDYRGDRRAARPGQGLRRCLAAAERRGWLAAV